MKMIREVSRAITFIDDKVILIERYKKVDGNMLHYFTVPGGGVEINETYPEAAIREMMEETTCQIEIVKELEIEDYPGGICHWYYGKYLSGTPKLGGEEKEHNNPDNSYEVKLIPFDEIEKLPFLGRGKELILQCIKEKTSN